MNDLLRQPRVLVVDDDARSRRLLRSLLEPVGAMVTEAAGGAEALELLDPGDWDLVLLDLTMPGMDGFEVLARIRERRPMEDLPVILVTGMDDGEARLRGLSARANEFLAKPVDQAELLARVGAQLAYRFARLELQERLRELERARAFRDFLADTVLRELRSPMTTIMGNLDLACLELDPASRSGRLVAASLEAAGRAAALASDTADLIRLTEGRLRPHPAAISLPATLREALDGVATETGSRGLRLVQTPGPALPPVRADGREVVRALAGLLRQAADETATGGWIEAGAGPGGDGRAAVITIRTSDGGLAGVVQRELSRQTDQPVPGAMSVRVALSRALLDVMGGRLRAAATGGSSMVTVELPVDRARDARASVALTRPGANPG